MTAREKNLLFLLVLVVIVSGGLFFVFLTHQWTTANYQKDLGELNTKLRQKKIVKLKMMRDWKKKMDHYQVVSLPEDPVVAKREYYHFLRNLMTECDFEEINITDNPREDETYVSKKRISSRSKSTKPVPPVYSRLTFFPVRGKASLPDLIDFLNKFERTPLLHKIKSLTVEPVDKKEYDSSRDPLEVSMTVEALIVQGTKHPETLMGFDNTYVPVDILTGLRQGPVGLAQLPWVAGPTGPFYKVKYAAGRPDRDYSVLSRKNIFVGYVPPPPPRKKYVPPPPKPPPKKEEPKEPPPETGPDVKEFVRLMMITLDGEQSKAVLRNRLGVGGPGEDGYHSLKTEKGYDSFRIATLSGVRTAVLGKVLKIDYRNVYFRWEDRVYCFHIGETLAQAVRQPLSETQLIELGLGAEEKEKSPGKEKEKKDEPKTAIPTPEAGTAKSAPMAGNTVSAAKTGDSAPEVTTKAGPEPMLEGPEEP